jgi:hypothetical protein
MEDGTGGRRPTVWGMEDNSGEDRGRRCGGWKTTRGRTEDEAVEDGEFGG